MAKMTLQQEIDQAFEHLCCYDRSEWDELVAAIQVQALRDAAGDMDAEYEERTAKVGAYGQTKIRAALLTGAGYARKRADQIEKEAGL